MMPLSLFPFRSAALGVNYGFLDLLDSKAKFIVGTPADGIYLQNHVKKHTSLDNKEYTM